VDTIAATDVEALATRLRPPGTRTPQQPSRPAHRRAHDRRGQAFFNRAIADGLLPPGASPAHQVAKPRQLPSTRRALTSNELTQINEGHIGRTGPATTTYIKADLQAVATALTALTGQPHRSTFRAKTLATTLENLGIRT
jgi:hypothetical protein